MVSLEKRNSEWLTKTSSRPGRGLAGTAVNDSIAEILQSKETINTGSEEDSERPAFWRLQGSKVGRERGLSSPAQS